MTVCFLINRYTNGGIERVVTRLANHMIQVGLANPLILTLYAEPDDLGLDPSVPLRSLDFVHDDTPGARTTPRRERVRRLRSFVREIQPDLVISFGTATNILAITAGIAGVTRLKVAERTNFFAVSPMKRLVRRIAYRHADAVVVQTERQRRRFRLHNRSVAVIPNPIEVADSVPPPEDRDFTIILVGRLAAVKQFDRFLREINLDRLEGWQVKIVGEGPQREEIESIIAERGMESRVDLVGYRDDVAAELARAAVFVLCSEYEGFPNALGEALAMGLSCVCFDLESGPETLIDHRESGLLVPDQDWDALKDALELVASSPELRRSFFYAAREAMKRFDIVSIARDWIA
jgi:glycosyltransferase involved in cell wall biosynthesis